VTIGRCGFVWLKSIALLLMIDGGHQHCKNCGDEAFAKKLPRLIVNAQSSVYHGSMGCACDECQATLIDSSLLRMTDDVQQRSVQLVLLA